MLDPFLSRLAKTGIIKFAAGDQESGRGVVIDFRGGRQINREIAMQRRIIGDETVKRVGRVHGGVEHKLPCDRLAEEDALMGVHRVVFFDEWDDLLQ